ncbi:hypothetical protein DMN91_007703, partial [Ooceraea biroi]
MPFRETYEINNREEGKAAQRDQSYKSCVLALLIFFFLCLILIVSCIPWKIQNLTDNTHDTDQHIGRQESQYGEQTRQILSTRQIIPVTTVITPTTAKTTERYTNIEEYVDATEPHIESSSQDKDEVITPLAIVPEEKADHYTTKILQYTENADKDIGLTMTRHDVTDDAIDTTLTSSSTQTVHITTKHHDVGIIRPVVNTKSAEENTTDAYSLNAIHNTVKSESVTENFTDFDKFETAKVDVITEDTTASTTTSNLFTDLEESTDVKYVSDKYHHEEPQFTTNTSNLTTSTSPARSIFEEDRNTEEYFTTKNSNYEESVTSENHKINETVTTESSFVEKKYTVPDDEKTPPTMEIKNVTEDSNSSANSYNTTEKYDEHTTSESAKKYSVTSTNNYTTTAASSAFYNNTTVSIISRNQDEMHISTTENIRPSDKNTTVCETGRCKQVAGTMLSYMNHSADPCEDFYEYACGGFEANPQLIDGETVLRSRNYQRIAREMSKREYKDSTFVTYYNSCVQYEKTMNFSERAKMGKVLEITTLFLLVWYGHKPGLFYSALLFDVVPELDEQYSPNTFTLKIGPAMYENPFMGEHVEDPCSEDEFGTQEHYVDLQALYNNYKRCKNDTRELMKSIKEALIVLNIFKNVNGNYLEWHTQLEYIENTVHTIDSIIMQEYFSQFPSKNEIREKYSMNGYSKITLEELENKCAFINWTQLINSLGINEINDNIYIHTALIESLLKLEEFSMKEPMSLNNAIMGLYAHKLYRELVVPRRNNVKDHCLQVATYLLRLEASSLYISSFADHEIIQINKIIEDTFNELKQTLRLEMQKAEWAKEEGRERLLEKIDSLKLALPAVSYFQDRDSLYKGYDMLSIFLHDNYFNNSMILLKRYRTLMYAEVKGQVDDPKQIWTYYATPFQSQARAIRYLNLNVIPYGIIDWSLMNSEISFNYFMLATLGNLIAHQIAHHFDANGIYYWNHIKNPQDALMHKDSFTNMNFEDYVDCQKNNLYQGPMNMTLPFTDQVVSFTIPQSTLNERLSDIVGLRLAYDTLVRTMSDAEEGLPWIKFRTEQLFYLAYAQ